MIFKTFYYYMQLQPDLVAYCCNW